MGTYFGGGFIFSGLLTHIHPDASLSQQGEKNLKTHLPAFSDINFSTGSQFDLTFELRPQHLTGLLFIYRKAKTSVVVFLRETEVRL